MPVGVVFFATHQRRRMLPRDVLRDCIGRSLGVLARGRMRRVCRSACRVFSGDREVCFWQYWWRHMGPQLCLQRAALAGDRELVRWFARHGSADLNTSFFECFYSRRWDMCKFLVQLGGVARSTLSCCHWEERGTGGTESPGRSRSPAYCSEER